MRFAQGTNSELSFANYPIAADGSWGGTFTIPTGAVPGNAQLIGQCFDASHAVQTTVDYAQAFRYQSTWAQIRGVAHRDLESDVFCLRRGRDKPRQFAKGNSGSFATNYRRNAAGVVSSRSHQTVPSPTDPVLYQPHSAH